MSRRDALQRSPRLSSPSLEERDARRSRADAARHIAVETWALDEVYENEPTRAAHPSHVALSEVPGSDEKVTRSTRESYVALSELPQIGSRGMASHASEHAVVADAPWSLEEHGYDGMADELGSSEVEEVTTFVVRPSYVAGSELDSVTVGSPVTTVADSPTP